MKKAYLILNDGLVFEGCSFGYEGETSGEVVFNTSMMGYQEILTDPSYQGQIIVMTYPEIGNYGINPLDIESRKIFASGFVVKSLSPIVSNFRAKGNLSDYLKKNKIPGIYGIDTRALTKHLRNEGARPGSLIAGNINLDKAKKKAALLPTMDGQDLAKVVSCTKPYLVSKGTSQIINFESKKSKKIKPKNKYKIIAYDYGIKNNILRMLYDYGFKVKVVPAWYAAENVLKENPDGIFLSNGPGDPAVCDYAIANVKKLLGKKPIFGICLGHQILSLALGAKTFKLKFGHRGGNQPVMDLTTGCVEITAQNHGFAVDPQSLPKDVKVSHVNLNDKTVEGISYPKLKAFSVQYHPEASPGPHDSHYLFKRFSDLIGKN
ncbi:MAG: carbamoyl phosphate synthase small subunit [Deltaproteobacteria bacterium RIFCSPLOWO2_12_FULL_40_28]|nr:MAG: carbamoyl phosphate synthase small subunit [Deltaproteobacteria bacterium RIFCSPHIGHO2_02_FULL_40_28]OGQ20280.1 MAG: carbamoyl phosphate synthase small subunit [Deltaproteobacteria bacterium RIFCSPHIGHO2_12_FULL_40_32]OGQ40391.1 MAG: carbamoyl phosphate synthase small subunit [Deltaproteobacteria bacterium RIFCSPLOWO2_02_FULL_40_36]OGQ54860.1 MAG: carbamoyl phosphate synthase small subunit [Deltaproteobacteria bacterium RIFCSPLOWO2_12_FULL_40_28]